MPRPRPPRPTRVGAMATDVSGVDPAGQPVEVPVATGRWTLLFLTSSCAPCQTLWAGAGADPDLVVVTPSPTTESRRAVVSVAPAGAVVVMSSETWHTYQVTGAPWRVVVDAGVVVEDAPAA